MDGNLSKNIVLLIVTTTAFLTSFTASSVNIALPAIGKEFSMNAVLLGWVVIIYPLAAAAFLVPFGRIADIHGRKKIFTYGLLAYTISSLLIAISTSSTMLISLRCLQGIGASMLFTTGVAILTSVFPLGERGKVLGINVTAVYIGLSTGPFLGGLLTQYFGWRSIFWVIAPLGLIIVTFVLLKLKGEWSDAKGEKFDLIGTVIYSISLVAIIYGFSLVPLISGISIVLVGILGIIAFIRWEIKVSSPLLNIKLFKNNSVFIFSNLAALIHFSSTFAITFLLSLYLQIIKGVDPQYAGIILVSMPAVQAIFSPVAGRFSDKIEPRILTSAGMTLNFIGLSLLAFIDQNTTIGFMLVSLTILGFGLALFSSPNTNAVMSSIDKSSYGVASAILATMRQVGFTFSMGIVMLIFTVNIGRVEIIPEYYTSFLISVRIAFITFSVLCFSGIFASLARGKVR